MTSSGVIYNLHEKGLKYFYDKDLKYPYVIVSLCLKGSVRWIYDSKEYKQEKNTLSLILPGHTVNVLRHSKDYTQAWMAFDPVKFINYELHLNNINKELFEQTPVIHNSPLHMSYTSQYGVNGIALGMIKMTCSKIFVIW